MADPKNPTTFPSTPEALLKTPPGGSAGKPYPSTAPKPSTMPKGGGAGVGVPFLFNRLDFIKNYANVVARTWADEQFLKDLLAKPAEVLAQAGVPTIPGAIIRPIQIKITGMGRMEEQVEDWAKGMLSGEYDLYLPMRPDGVDAEVVGGGDIGCCCTPCCCCT